MKYSDKEFLKKIKNNVRPQEYLPQYSSYMMEIYHEYSMIRLALNYYTLYEVCNDEDNNIVENVKVYISKIDEIIHNYVLNECDNDKEYVKAVKSINNIRNSVIEKMKVLTSYTDDFQIYEHIVKRHANIELDYDIDKFISKVFQWIFAEQDNVLVNEKIKMIVGEVPVRMTKNRFFDIINDSLSIYNGSSKDAVDNFIYMIRSCSTIYQPKKNKNDDAFLHDFYKLVKKVDFTKASQDKIDDLREQFQVITEYITKRVNVFLHLQDVINNLYVALLSKVYCKEVDEPVVNSVNIINMVYKAIEENTEIDSSVDDFFVALEGKQESVYEDIAKCEGLLFNINEENMDVVEEIGETKKIDSLNTITKLLSDSVFIELNDKVDEIPTADTSYIMCVRDELVAEFTELFKKNSKEFNRSIMATVLSKLPVFFNSQQEIKDYLDYSFGHCNNENEIKAAINAINEMMYD